MAVSWDSVFVSAIMGFVGGLLATGGRTMLAPIVFRRKLRIGNISRSEPFLKDVADEYWYIPVEVKANNMWKLIVSHIQDVRATISFIESNGMERILPASWIEPTLDSDSITLQIDGKYNGILVATSRGKMLLPIGGLGDEEAISGNQAIILELNSGHTFLGRWFFKEAIVKGVMREVSPQ